MKLSRIPAAIFAALTLAVLAFGAGTVVTTETTYTSIRRVKFAWTSSAGGAADATTTGFYTGQILAIVTDPDGTDVPTADYDIVVNNDDGVDIFNGAGANKSATVTETISATLGVDLGVAVASKLTLAVTNAGASKKGIVWIFLR